MSLTKWQLKAIPYAAEKGGDHLDALGKTDLAKMTQDEWLCFVEVLCVAYQKKVFELQDDEVPF